MTGAVENRQSAMNHRMDLSALCQRWQVFQRSEAEES